MITSLSIENFKCWRSIPEMRLAPITALFGTNSSGKTSLLQWLLMMKQTVQSADRLQVLNFGDERDPVQLGGFGDVVYRHELNSSLTCCMHWQLPEPLKIDNPDTYQAMLFQGNSASFSCAVRGPSGEPEVSLMRYGFDGHEFSYQPQKSGFELAVTGPSGFSFRRTVGRRWELPRPVKCYGFPDQVSSYYQNAGFLTDLQLAFEKLFHGLYYLGPLREYPRRQYSWSGHQPSDVGQRGEKVVDALLASRTRLKPISRGEGDRGLSLEEFTALWLQRLGLISQFSVDEVAKGSSIHQVWMRQSADSARVLITDVGFGISQILPVIVLCYYVPQGSVVVLEQPEIHLHPAVQSGLADIFIDAMRNRGIQLIIESHSEHLLRRLQRRIAEGNLQQEECALYFCDVQDNESCLLPLQLDAFGNIGNWPKDFFGDEFGEMAAITMARLQRTTGAAR